MLSSRRFAGRRRLVAAALIAVSSLAACSDDNGGTIASSTTAPSAPTTSLVATTTEPSTEVTTTTSMGSSLESISFLIQGLLTTEQIGGGWLDQGRQVVPPGSNQLSGFLCEEGESAVGNLGGRLDAQVSTTFRRSGDVGLSVFESLMWGDRDQVTADFTTLSGAVAACTGAAYTTTELGDLLLELQTAPELGTAALSYRFGPAVPSTENPWLEQQTTSVLLSDPGSSVALVITIGASTVHDPARLDTTELEPAEFDRIVEAAVNRILEGL